MELMSISIQELSMKKWHVSNDWIIEPSFQQACEVPNIASGPQVRTLSRTLKSTSQAQLLFASNGHEKQAGLKWLKDLYRLKRRYMSRHHIVVKIDDDMGKTSFNLIDPDLLRPACKIIFVWVTSVQGSVQQSWKRPIDSLLSKLIDK